jgi:hypothetical protein
LTVTSLFPTTTTWLEAPGTGTKKATRMDGHDVCAVRQGVTTHCRHFTAVFYPRLMFQFPTP